MTPPRVRASVCPARGALVIRARAKVNLALEVLGRRADGYHDLLTCLIAVDVADRVTVEVTPGGEPEVACEAPGVPGGVDNLAWRAADRLRRASGTRLGARIRVDKAIPVAGGLGGGSADAAAVLWGLNRLWGLRWPRERLQGLAAELGMDVPFFLGPGPALASGRGEVLSPLRLPRPLWLVLVNPRIPLPTREVYARVGPDAYGSGARVRRLVKALSDGPRAVAAALWNGLEPVVAGLWPGLAVVRQALARAGVLGTVMSGSGPTVVGLAASRRAAAAAAASLAGEPWWVRVTRTVGGPALTAERPAGLREWARG